MVWKGGTGTLITVSTIFSINLKISSIKRKVVASIDVRISEDLGKSDQAPSGALHSQWTIVWGWKYKMAGKFLV